MTDDLAHFWVHNVSVERYTGAKAYTDAYATAETVAGFVDDGQRIVGGPNGDQVTSTATVFLPAGTADVPVESRVTLPAAFGGRVARVVAAARRDAGALPLPEHLELSLL